MGGRLGGRAVIFPPVAPDLAVHASHAIIMLLSLLRRLQMLRRNSPASTSGLPGAASRASSYWRGRYTLR